MHQNVLTRWKPASLLSFDRVNVSRGQHLLLRGGHARNRPESGEAGARPEGLAHRRAALTCERGARFGARSPPVRAYQGHNGYTEPSGESWCATSTATLFLTLNPPARVRVLVVKKFAGRWPRFVDDLSRNRVSTGETKIDKCLWKAI
jgi:hypothetical protein